MIKLKLTGKFSAILIGLLLLLAPASSWAGDSPSATLYLSPVSATVAQGATLSVELRLKITNDSSHSTRARLTYPADKIEVTSVNPSSTFGVLGENSYGSGFINVAYGSFGKVSGDQLFVTINFKINASSGDANVTIDPIIDPDNHSYVAGDTNGTGANILNNVLNGTYTITKSSSAPPQPILAPSQLSQNPAKLSLAASPSDKNKQAGTTTDNGTSTTKIAETVTPNAQIANARLTAKPISPKDKIIMLLSLTALVVGALAGRTANRKYKDRKAKKKVSEHHGASKKETVADIVARIKRKNRSEETVAELAARIKRKKHH